MISSRQFVRQFPVPKPLPAGRQLASFPFALSLLSVALLSVVLSGCNGSRQDAAQSTGTGGSGPDDTAVPTALTKVQLRLNWLPEAEHGGYYAAVVHGFYRDQGLDVEILGGGPGVPVREEVATKRMTFGISNADQVLTIRAQDANIVGVFAPLQTSPRCIMVHQKSGITSFDGLENLTIGLSENSSFGAFLKKNVPLTGCSFVPYAGSMQRFLREDAFAMQGYVFSEPFVASSQGGDPHSLLAADIGFNPYTSVLITHGDTLVEQPDLVRRMVAASRQGWQQYLTDAADTNAMIQAQNPEMQQDILAFGVEQLRPLCKAGTDAEPFAELGAMTLERWTQTATMLVECGVIDAGSVEPSAAFTARFLTDSPAPQ